MNHKSLSGSKYIDTYYRLLSKYSQLKEIGVTESHHIIPKFCGGTNIKTNLVNIPIRVHFILHILLWKHFKHLQNSSLAHKAGLSINAFLMDNSGFRILTKIPKSRFIKDIRCHLVENGKRAAKMNIGRKMTTEQKKTMSESHWTKSGVITHPMLGKHHTDASKRLMGNNKKNLHYWKAISPEGIEHQFRAAEIFSNDFNLSVDTMKIYGLTKSGDVVLPCARISQATQRRLNTSGWTFFTSDAPFI